MKDVNVSKVTLPLLCVFPIGPVSIEGVPIDPEVIEAVDWPVFQYASGALRGCADAVSKG